MRVIITYASAGAGHFKAAEAIYDYLKQRCPAISLQLADLLDKTNPFFKFSYVFGYSLLVKRAPFLWRLAFWFTGSGLFGSFSQKLARFYDRLNAKRFIAFLIQNNPDIIISTHFLSSQICAMLKQEGRIKSRMITVVTDLSVHPFWVSPSTDAYIVATSVTRDELIKNGVDSGIIRDSGIPVRRLFLKDFDKDGLRKKFGIEEKRFTMLVATGSFGVGPMERIVKSLHKDAQLLVVCANNKRLYKKLKEAGYPGVRVYGFVDNMQELMAVSDLMITKPGGLSISEALVMELPQIFISAIPGQEAGNIAVLKKYSIGLFPRDIGGIRDMVLDLKNDPRKIMAEKEAIRKIKKPDCLKEICNVVRENSLGPAC